MNLPVFDDADIILKVNPLLYSASQTSHHISKWLSDIKLCKVAFVLTLLLLILLLSLVI